MAPASGVIIGLMSGTAADGISAAAARFAAASDGSIGVELISSLQVQYSAPQRERLLRTLESPSLDDIARLDFELGGWLADAALSQIAHAKLRREEVRAIASHGHTIWHAAPAATWQIGQSAVIVERTGIDVVSDFRVRDVAAGGQGAPLVSIADAMLFAHPARPRALQNLGGIANVSVVAPRESGEPVLAFDTGPGCAVIDGVTRRLVPSLPYDLEGRLALTGAPIEGVAESLLLDDFFSAPPPKSTGRERFDSDYIDLFIAGCQLVERGARAGDIIATAVDLTARSIGLAYERFVPRDVTEVLLSGGGAKNPALVRAITAALPGRKVRRFSDEFFDDEAKEAVAFALLGWLHLERRAGNLPSATGARGERILGKLTPA